MQSLQGPCLSGLAGIHVYSMLTRASPSDPSSVAPLLLLLLALAGVRAPAAGPMSWKGRGQSANMSCPAITPRSAGPGSAPPCGRASLTGTSWAGPAELCADSFCRLIDPIRVARASASSPCKVSRQWESAAVPALHCQCVHAQLQVKGSTKMHRTCHGNGR